MTYQIPLLKSPKSERSCYNSSVIEVQVVVVVVVVALSSLARIFGKGLTIHSPPELLFKWTLARAH